MSHGLLEILKYFFLALLWLFFLYAARMVLVDVRRSRSERASDHGAPPKGRSAIRLRVIEPTDQRGRVYELNDEITLGRSPACVVNLEDDNFASSIHARVFRHNGEIFAEDLGSTNGTYVNEERLAGPMPLERGDRLRVGGTVLEVRR